MNTQHDHDHLDDGTCLDGYLVPPLIRDTLYRLAQALTAAEHHPSPTTDGDSQQIAKRRNNSR